MTDPQYDLLVQRLIRIEQMLMQANRGVNAICDDISKIMETENET